MSAVMTASAAEILAALPRVNQLQVAAFLRYAQKHMTPGKSLEHCVTRGTCAEEDMCFLCAVDRAVTRHTTAEQWAHYIGLGTLAKQAVFYVDEASPGATFDAAVMLVEFRLRTNDLTPDEITPAAQYGSEWIVRVLKPGNTFGGRPLNATQAGVVLQYDMVLVDSRAGLAALGRALVALFGNDPTT